MGPSWSGTARLKGAPLPALLCEWLLAPFSYCGRRSTKRGFSPVRQCERGGEALHDLQDVHGVRLCWALQPVLLAERPGPPLSPHIADPTQPATECNPGLARSQPAAQLRNTSTPPWWRVSQSTAADPGDTESSTKTQHWWDVPGNTNTDTELSFKDKLRHIYQIKISWTWYQAVQIGTLQWQYDTMKIMIFKPLWISNLPAMDEQVTHVNLS